MLVSSIACLVNDADDRPKAGQFGDIVADIVRYSTLAAHGVSSALATGTRALAMSIINMALVARMGIGAAHKSGLAGLDGQALARSKLFVWARQVYGSFKAVGGVDPNLLRDLLDRTMNHQLGHFIRQLDGLHGVARLVFRSR
jgi:hypothetical protein